MVRNRHYVRTDGMLASYYPDFIIKIADQIFVVETKSEKDATGDSNVQAKRRSALDWLAKINELQPDDRMNSDWQYALLDDTTFYTLHKQNANISEILGRYVLTKNVIEGRLF